MNKINFSLYICAFLFYNAMDFCQAAAVTSNRSVVYRVGGTLAGEYVSIDGHLKNRPTKKEDRNNIANENFASDAHHACHKFQVSTGLEFGAIINKFYYLGLTGTKHFTNASNSMYTSIGDSVHFDHQLQLKSYTNLFFKFGYKIMPSLMFYGFVGPSFANWSHKTVTFFYIPAEGRKDVLSSFEKNNKSIGLGFGGGIEFLKNDKYAISMEYTKNIQRAERSDYGSSYHDHAIMFNQVTPNTVPADVQKSVRLSYSTIGLRFSYFFSL